MSVFQFFSNVHNDGESNPMFCSNSQNENLSAFPTTSRQDSCLVELNNCVQLQYHRAQIFLHNNYSIPSAAALFFVEISVYVKT